MRRASGAISAPGKANERSTPLPERPHHFGGAVEGLLGEVSLPPIVAIEQEEANFHAASTRRQKVLRVDDIPLGLGHLPAVYEEVLPVQPVVDELRAGNPFDDGPVVVVVAVDVVDASAVNVELVTEVLCDHGGVLNVPRRAAPTDLRLPGVSVLTVAVPENEVPEVPSLPRVGVLGEAVPLLRPPGQVQSVYGAEAGMAQGVVVDITLVPVGVTVLEQAGDQLRRLVDAGSRAGDRLRELQPEQLAVVQEGPCVRLRKILQGDTLLLTLRDRLILEVGEVDHPPDVETAVLEVALQHVLEYKGPVVSEVRSTIDRGATGEHLHLSGFTLVEHLLPLGHGVVKDDALLSGRFHVLPPWYVPIT